MSARHLPATELPWRAGTAAECGGNKAYAALLICAADGRSLGVISHGFPTDPRDEVKDAEYVRHAVNAYGNLVTTVQALCRTCDSSVSTEAFRIEKAARALLRDLGEDHIA